MPWRRITDVRLHHRMFWNVFVSQTRSHKHRNKDRNPNEWLLKSRKTMRYWTILFVFFVIFLSLVGYTKAHLAKEFTSAHKEEARSIEPLSLEADGQQKTLTSMDINSVLCEKYNEWSVWSTCSRKCEQTRVRRCKVSNECGGSLVKEKRTCVRSKEPCLPLSYKVIGMPKRNRMIEELLYDLLYAKWTSWSPCTRSCRQRRQRKCKIKDICVQSYIKEERRCKTKGAKCEHRYTLKPADKDKTEDDKEKTKRFDIQWNGSVTGEQFSQDGSLSIRNNSFGLVDDSVNKSMNRLQRYQLGVRVRKRSRTSRGFPQNQRRKNMSIGDEFLAAQKKCGIRPPEAAGSYRVVGGQEVQKNSWPWQVALLTKSNKQQYCGGTLIAPRWVLTAAHCVRKKGKKRKLIVRVGEHDLDLYDPSQQDIIPGKDFPHPNFNYQTITNDIALIKLRHVPAAFTNVGYACLPQSPKYSPKRNELCTIVGWGKLKNTHRYGSDSLQEAKVPVVRHRRCQRVFAYPITNKQVCAGRKKGGTDSCAGDSGGPLLCVVMNKNVERHYIYGVTSYGEGCGRRGKYGIYTKVTSYLDWIYNTIETHGR